MRLLPKRAKADRPRQRQAPPRETLAGYAYHAPETDRSSNEIAQRPAAQSWFDRPGVRRTSHLLVLVIIIASLINVLTLSTNAKILPLTSGGSVSLLHDEATYQAAASQLFSKSILNHNKLTADTAGISRQLRSQFPELQTVSVTIPLLAHRPIVYIQTVQPALILATTRGSFVIANNGTALLSASQLPTSQPLAVPTVTDQSGLSVTIGHEVLTQADVGFIQTVAAQLQAQHLSIASMTLPASSSELDVHLTGQPYFIKFNLANTDARQQVGTFFALLSQLQSQGTPPTQYVDVRVDGRAYYQ